MQLPGVVLSFVLFDRDSLVPFFGSYTCTLHQPQTALQVSLHVFKLSTMATGFSATPRKEGTWTKLVIFMALYCLILESLLEWVLVLYLYGNHEVDSKMTPSLILSLVSVSLTVSIWSLLQLIIL